MFTILRDFREIIKYCKTVQLTFWWDCCQIKFSVIITLAIVNNTWNTIIITLYLPKAIEITNYTFNCKTRSNADTRPLPKIDLRIGDITHDLWKCRCFFIKIYILKSEETERTNFFSINILLLGGYSIFKIWYDKKCCRPLAFSEHIIHSWLLLFCFYIIFVFSSILLISLVLLFPTFLFFPGRSKYWSRWTSLLCDPHVSSDCILVFSVVEVFNNL